MKNKETNNHQINSFEMQEATEHVARYRKNCKRKIWANCPMSWNLVPNPCFFIWTKTASSFPIAIWCTNTLIIKTQLTIRTCNLYTLLSYVCLCNNVPQVLLYHVRLWYDYILLVDKAQTMCVMWHPLYYLGPDILLRRDTVTSFYMMTSSNGNIFRVTGHLCGEFQVVFIVGVLAQFF